MSSLAAALVPTGVLPDLRIGHMDYFPDGSMYHSRDIQSLNPELFALAERFRQLVAQSDSLAFDLERRIVGTCLKTTQHELAEIGYELLRFIGYQCPPRHEVGEALKILLRVLSDMCMTPIVPTGRPLNVIGPDGFCEGELINNIIVRAREAFAHPHARSASLQRKREVAQELQRTEKLVAQLAETTAQVYATRRTLNCRLIEHASPHGPLRAITLEETARHWQRFKDALLAKPSPEALLGWWRKREYLSEVGYRYHAVFFFDHSHPLALQSLRAVNKAWELATDGMGIIREHPYVPSDARSWGSGFIGWGSETGRNLLISSLAKMISRDLYLRLEKSPEHPHCELMKVPKRKTLSRSIPGAPFTRVDHSV